MNLFRLPIGPVVMRMEHLPDLPMPIEITLAPSEEPPPRAGKRLVLVAMGDSTPLSGFFNNATGELSDVNDESGGETRVGTYQGIFTDQENATGTTVTTFADGSQRTEYWTITPD